MANVARGAGMAAVVLALVGLALPYALARYSVPISRFLRLPSPENLWISFLFFGFLLAAMSFLVNAYTKGEFPWLFGKIGGGLVWVGFFAYLLLYLPEGAISSVTSGVQAGGLLALVYVAVGLSYVHLLLDFAEARRKKGASGGD